MKTFSKLAAAAALTIMASQVDAATFHFDLDATDFWNANVPNASRYEGTFNQVYGIDTVDGNARATAAGTVGKNTVDGITVTASATKPGAVAHPFMDSRGPLAGLGVCSSGLISSGPNTGKSQCSSAIGTSPGDDNLLFSELLELQFGGMTVAIDGLQIRDANHNLINNTLDAILINNTSYATGANGQVILAGLTAASVFEFTSSTSQKEIYLSVLEVSKVPLPAAGFLLIGAIGGLGAMSRRKKRTLC